MLMPGAFIISICICQVYQPPVIGHPEYPVSDQVFYIWVWPQLPPEARVLKVTSDPQWGVRCQNSKSTCGYRKQMNPEIDYGTQWSPGMGRCSRRLTRCPERWPTGCQVSCQWKSEHYFLRRGETWSEKGKPHGVQIWKWVIETELRYRRGT